MPWGTRYQQWRLFHNKIVVALVGRKDVRAQTFPRTDFFCFKLRLQVENVKIRLKT